MTSPPRRQFLEVNSNGSSPQKQQLGKSKQIRPMYPIEPILRFQTGQICLNFQTSPQKAKQKVMQVAQHIKKNPDKSFTLIISFDSFGIDDKANYFRQNYQNLFETLKIFRRINNGHELKEIRRIQSQSTLSGDIKCLKHFKFSFINWVQVTVEDQLNFIQSNALTERITLNLEGSVITKASIEYIQKILKNNIGEYKQIEINLSNCPNASSSMLQQLLSTQTQSTPKVYKLRFVNWGANVQRYFGYKSPNNFQTEIEETSKGIQMLRQKFKGGRTQLTLDFRGWSSEFKLNEIEDRNNKQRENVQSLGLFSKTNNTNRDRQYNIVFLA